MEEYRNNYDMYTLAVIRYEKLKEENAHLNFELLDFTPLIQDPDHYKELKDAKMKEDLRFVRTTSIVGKGQVEDAFKKFDEKLEKRLKALEELKKKEEEDQMDESAIQEGGESQKEEVKSVAPGSQKNGGAPASVKKS